MTNKPLPVIGSFGKGIENSCSVNFSTSGAPGFCDTKCPYHRDCYAKRAEIRPDRLQLKQKLERHEKTDSALIARRALAELSKRSKRVDIPWIRISTNGSVPMVPTIALGKALRALAEFARDNSIPMHFPAESEDKARRYRRIMRGIATVRESVFSRDRFFAARCAVSFVSGTRDQTRLQRVDSARSDARERTARSGRKCIVCPAVAQRYLNHNVPNSKAKCGNCTACADSLVDIIYPLH